MSVHRINLFRSGTSLKILMVISPSWLHGITICSILVGWCRYNCVYGASSVGRGDWSRQWIAILLVSVIPTHLLASSIICLTIFSVSLRIWITTFRIQGCLWPNVFSQWLLWRKVIDGKCWSLFVYNYQGKERVFLWVCGSVIICMPIEFCLSGANPYLRRKRQSTANAYQLLCERMQIQYLWSGRESSVRQIKVIPCCFFSDTNSLERRTCCSMAI